jgi:membrane-anchored protein YejM (alkaline phosphatase superfamily)
MRKLDRHILSTFGRSHTSSYRRIQCLSLIISPSLPLEHKQVGSIIKKNLENDNTKKRLYCTIVVTITSNKTYTLSPQNKSTFIHEINKN